MCPGLDEDWDATPGLREAYDAGWAASTFDDDTAARVWPALRGLQSGRVVFTVPPEPAPCGATALKPLFMACDHWRRAGVLDDVDVHLVLPGASPLALDGPDARIEEALASYDVRVHRESTGSPGSTAAASRWPRRRGRRWSPTSPSRTSCRTTARPGGWSSAGLAGEHPAGLVDVDPLTMRHRRFPDVWSLGDVADLRTRPSGGALRKQVAVLAPNLLAARLGRPLAHYDGYTVMPITTARHRLMLVEVDRDGRPQPTVPFPDLDEAAGGDVVGGPLRAAAGLLATDPARPGLASPSAVRVGKKVQVGKPVRELVLHAGSDLALIRRGGLSRVEAHVQYPSCGSTGSFQRGADVGAPTVRRSLGPSVWRSPDVRFADLFPPAPPAPRGRTGPESGGAASRRRSCGGHLDLRHDHRHAVRRRYRGSTAGRHGRALPGGELRGADRDGHDGCGGRLRVRGPGAGVLTSSGAVKAAFKTTWYSGYFNPQDSTLLTLNEGDHLTGISWNLADATTEISGTITGTPYGAGTADPLPGATVGLFLEGDYAAPIATDTTDAQGAYAFPGRRARAPTRSGRRRQQFKTTWYSGYFDPTGRDHC